MEPFLGSSNSLVDYLPVVLVYGGLFLVMRHARSQVELNFRRTFWVLYFGWAVGVFAGNYAFYLIGIMSFLPWLNNFMHTFLWIGFCLGFLYAGCYHKPLWEQFALFAIFSFIVKWAEHELLGTWELSYFFILEGNLAYIIGWSVLDGLYPVISQFGLRMVSRFVDGVIVPS